MADKKGPPPPKCSAKKADGRPCRNTPQPNSTRCWHHSFKVPGRPTKLDVDLTQRILDAVLEGNYLETAAQAAGIGKTTLYRWLRRGDDAEALVAEHLDEDQAGADAYEHLDPAEWPYLDFRHALKSAEAFAETELLRRTITGGRGWQAYMTVLERRHPERWGRRDRVMHEGAVDLGKPKVVVPDTDAKRALIAEILAGALRPVSAEPYTVTEDTPDE